MKKPRLFIYFVNARSMPSVRWIRLGSGALLGLGLVLSIAFVGIVRLAWYGTSYARLEIKSYKERIVNNAHRVFFASMDQSIKNESNTLENVIQFEDANRITYGLPPISNDVRKAGIGGTRPCDTTGLDSRADTLVVKAVAIQERLAALFRKVQLERSTFEQLSNHVRKLHGYWMQRPSIWPATGKITSGFGYRPDPIYGNEIFHDGLDIANEIGTPVFSPAFGTVKECGFKQDFGRSVVIEHPESGVQTIYAHLHNFVVTANETVQRGQLIGFIGNSGKSTGPHLHYEIRNGGKPINPAQYILPSDQTVD